MRWPLTFVALLTGCGLLGDGVAEEEMQIASSTSASISDGIGSATFKIDEGVSSFILTGTSERTLAIARLQGPDGVLLDANDWYSSNESLTMAIWAQSNDAVLNWPIREADGALTPGDYQIDFLALSNLGIYASDGDIDVLIQSKRDENFSAGGVTLKILYADGVKGEPGVQEATEAAVERLKAVWNAHGISSTITFGESTIDPFLEYSSEGSDEVLDVTSGNTGDTLTLLICEKVNDDGALYGISGNIPGALISTARSAVAVSWATHAGSDAEFSEEDIVRFGETMAHELGHFMGLFHPVEIGYNYWDALGDTPQCDTYSDCKEQLGENMMYPFPVCENWTDCVEQETLSAHQQGVLHRYGGVL